MDRNNPSSSKRIEQLERKIHVVIMTLIVLPSLAFLLGAVANQIIRAKSVTTQKLVVVDANGKERAAIYLDDNLNEPVIELYNEDHSLILNAGKSPENGVGFIQLFDKAGKFKTGYGGNAVK